MVGKKFKNTTPKKLPNDFLPFLFGVRKSKDTLGLLSSCKVFTVFYTTTSI